MYDDEAEKRGIARSAHFRAYVFGHAESLVRAILDTYHLMQVEQQQLLLDMGYSFVERFALSTHLAETLYRTGLPKYPPEQLQDLMSEGVLQALLYHFLCNGEYIGYTWATDALAKQPAFRKYYRKPYEEMYGRLPDYSYELSRSDGDGEEAHNTMSQVSPAHRRTRSRALSPRTRRLGGRVGRGDLGAVSEP